MYALRLGDLMLASGVISHVHLGEPMCPQLFVTHLAPIPPGFLLFELTPAASACVKEGRLYLLNTVHIKGYKYVSACTFSSMTLDSINAGKSISTGDSLLRTHSSDLSADDLT